MPSVFFKIDTTDITAYIDVQSYAVNREDVFEEWEDGNWITHRVIARTRYTGSFQAGFASAAGFTAFMTLLSTKKNADGYYPVTAYINNTGTMETFNAFLDVANDDDKWDAKHSRQWQVSTVAVTQR